MTYDALSRPLTRTEPDQFSQWTWGSTPASYNVGQLVAECSGSGSSCGASPAYSESRTFDSTGRLSTRAISEFGNAGNDPGGVFLFTTGYSATTGLLNTLTYPISTSGFALNLQYGYGYGLLSSVTDTSDTTGTCGSTCTLWTANAMNAFGQITQETLGNGVVMNRTYDAVTSWLSVATGGVGGGAALLNQSYLEDEDGNIIQRQQNNAPVVTESFAYDADNRLTCTALSSTCTTPTLAYDAGAAGPGNITSQTGLGTYSYPAAGQPRPHAVASITGTFNGIVNPTFAYDANGNMTDRASTTQNVYWMSFNYPASIAATDVTGSEAVSFNYGPDRQRIQQNYSGPSGYETTYYVGGLIDVVFNGTTNYRQYIYAGRKPVAEYSRTSAGVNTMSYMLEDHQGSLSAITSNAGASDIGESFSAFGQRRNPITWSGAPTTGDLNTIAGYSRQGYTFQTWLGQSMGLNHMNGRVEDAILGRFLSPDPHITDRGNAQSYNRYSYVNNNPLTYRDPTGFRKCTDCGDGDPGGGDPGGGDTGGGDTGGGDTGGGNTGGGNIGGDPSGPPSPDPCANGGCIQGPTVQCTFCCGSNSGCWDVPPPPQPTLLPPPPVQIGGLPSFPHIASTTCSSGTLANISKSLIQNGKSLTNFGSQVTQAGGQFVLAGLLLSVVGAPEAGVPTAAFGASVGASGGLITLAGIGLQTIGGAIQAYQGNFQPLVSAGIQASAAGLESLVNKVFPGSMDASPFPDPLDPVVDSLAGENPCP